MKLLRFEGYSDDTFGEYGITNEDHDNCASGKRIVFKVWSPGENDGLFVVGQYCPGPLTGWMVGVGRLNEDDDCPLPPWSMFIGRAERPYTPTLIIEAPDDVTVEHVGKS
jgi:hypothetical protein